MKRHEIISEGRDDFDYVDAYCRCGKELNSDELIDEHLEFNYYQTAIAA